MAVKDIIVQKTPPGTNHFSSNFDKEGFETAIWQKGYNVIHEKALKCPCKSKNSNQQSDCKNCGGTGWIFINPTETRMIIHSMNRSTKFKDWTEENLGTVSISAMIRDELSYMDRVVITDSKAFFSEVIYPKKMSDSNTMFAFTTYKIKAFFYVGLFVNVDSALTKLVEDTDYTFDGNKFYLNESFFTDENQDTSITIRYSHAPEYHVLDLPRESMQSFSNGGGKQEELLDLPISAVAKRAHYILDMENIANSRLVDNSFFDHCEDEIK